jgi:hypothetical protein
VRGRVGQAPHVGEQGGGLIRAAEVRALSEGDVVHGVRAAGVGYWRRRRTSARVLAVRVGWTGGWRLTHQHAGALVGRDLVDYRGDLKGKADGHRVCPVLAIECERGYRTALLGSGLLTHSTGPMGHRRSFSNA